MHPNRVALRNQPEMAFESTRKFENAWAKSAPVRSSQRMPAGRESCRPT